MNSGNIDTKNKKDAGDKLRVAREKLGLTQAEVAKKAKMTVNYYAMIERGEVNLTFDKIQSNFAFFGINRGGRNRHQGFGSAAEYL